MRLRPEELPTVLKLLSQLLHVDEPAATHLDPGNLARAALPYDAQWAHAEEYGNFGWIRKLWQRLGQMRITAHWIAPNVTAAFTSGLPSSSSRDTNLPSRSSSSRLRARQTSPAVR